MIGTAPRCEAQVGWRFGDYAERVPTWCRQHVGLRALAFRATSSSVGDVHYYCAAPHHRERVEAQVRRGVQP